MNSYEIKESVLATVTAEAKALEYIRNMLIEYQHDYSTSQPWFVLQAVPLIPPEQPLELYTNEIKEVVYGDNRKRNNLFDIRSSVAPTATIHGIYGRTKRDNPQCIIDLHRKGYIGVVFRVINHDTRKNKVERKYILETHYMLFDSYAKLCDEFIKTVSFNSPYIINCTLYNAENTVLKVRGLTEPEIYRKNTLEWPILLRQPGESFEVIAEELKVLFYNAYGIEKPPK